MSKINAAAAWLVGPVYARFSAVSDKYQGAAP
jgi:hypothetical protein